MSVAVSAQEVEHFFEVVSAVGEVEPSNPDARAAWDRQFPIQRLMGYGVDLGDALLFERLRADGMPWAAGATTLADYLLRSASVRGMPVSAETQREVQRRASALLRMSQMFDEGDSAARSEVYARAADLFERAHEATPGHSRALISTSGGPLAAWWFRAAAASGPVVAVVGGGEGWAMDWEASARAMAARGINVLLVDGPGQGESRLLHQHYLTVDWVEAWGDVIAHIRETSGDVPLGILGHSMGGTFATLIASRWPDFTAVCNNGGPQVPLSLRRERARIWHKLERFCERLDEAHVEEAWRTVEAKPETVTTTASFLMLYASNDPLVTEAECRQVFGWVPSTDKSLHTFVDADHCLYRFPTDKENLIADWFALKLGVASGTDSESA